MNTTNKTKLPYSHWLFFHLANNQGLLILSLLACLCGALVGMLMVGFEWAIIELRHLLYSGDPGLDFELSQDWQRIAIPIGAMCLLGLFMKWLAPSSRFTGVAHVIDRLTKNDAILPLKNAFVQAVGALTALASGMSIGREGPAIHMGAAIASIGGRNGWLPANSNRILIACGAAAAVAASFNTPLAGVILAMEVILMSYSIAGFAPVILSAVTATSVALYFNGDNVAFYIPHFDIGSLVELRWLAVTGLTCGVISAAFVKMIDTFGKAVPARFVFSRIVLAGCITAGLALITPAIMGVGYATVNLSFTGQLALSSAIVILGCKLFASAAAIGLGVPAGVIGPTLVIGALTGTVMGYCGQELGLATSPIAFYALVGVGAMMCATLHAPLAALTAILELTGNPNVIMPGMFVLIIAYLVNKTGFKSEPLFLHVLRLRGQPWIPDERLHGLQKTSVAEVMCKDFAVLTANSTQAELISAVEEELPVIFGDKLIPAQEAKSWLDIRIASDSSQPFEQTELENIGQSCGHLAATASLYSAWHKISCGEADNFIIHWRSTSGDIIGIVTPDTIRGYVDLEFCPLPER